MTFGLFATPVAFAYMQKAKKAYDEAYKKFVALKDRAEAVVDQYQREKEILDIMRTGRDEEGMINAPLKDVTVEFGLNLGNLGGKKLSAESYVAVNNHSGKDIRVVQYTAKLSVYDEVNGGWIPLYSPISGGTGYTPYFQGNESDGSNVIPKMKSYCSKLLPVEGLQALSKGNMKLLRNAVAKMYGKKLVTSITPKMRGTFSPLAKKVKADIGLVYIYDLPTGEPVMAQGLWLNQYGSFSYRGEAYYPLPMGLEKVLWDVLSIGVTLFMRMSKDNEKETITPDK